MTPKEAIRIIEDSNMLLGQQMKLLEKYGETTEALGLPIDHYNVLKNCWLEYEAAELACKALRQMEEKEG